MLAGGVGAGALLIAGLVAAVWGSGKTSSQDTLTSDAGGSGAQPAAQISVTATVQPPIVAVSALPAVPTSASVPAAVPPAPARPPTPAPRPPSPATRPAPAKPKTGCNPPFVIDENGDRQYKPECL
jgi:hypothetical protein